MNVKEVLSNVLKELDKPNKDVNKFELLGNLGLLIIEAEKDDPLPEDVLEVFDTDERRKFVVTAFVSVVGLSAASD